MLLIENHLQEILECINVHSNILIKSSPGSGKTTKIPPFLSKNIKGKILVLEPRKIATKYAAKRIADENNWILGKEIGYAYRFEKKYSENSKIIFFTEGTFLKYLKSNPDLLGIDVVVLDEFHERHVQTDLAFAILLKIKERNPSLKIILMSATIDSKIQNFEPIEIVGHNYNTNYDFLENKPNTINLPIEKKVILTLNKICTQKLGGNILIFLKGMKEILTVKKAILPFENSYDIFILHSDTSDDEQSKIMNEKQLKPKIILSTNIAESSITIPGVKIVIDGGEKKEIILNEKNQVEYLLDKKISKSSAEQRAGRSSRQSNGYCFRLYTKFEFEVRNEFDTPEILRVNFIDSLLALYDLRYGNLIRNKNKFLDIPKEINLLKAQKTLQMLGAIEMAKGHKELDTNQNEMNLFKITELGKTMARMPIHPRLSKILIESKKSKIPENEIFDFLIELKDFDRRTMTQIENIYNKIESQFVNIHDNVNDNFIKIIASAYVDKIAKFNSEKNEFLLCDGSSVPKDFKLDINSKNTFFIILYVNTNGRVEKAIPIDIELLYSVEPFPFSDLREIICENNRNYILQKTVLQKLIIEESKIPAAYELLNNNERQISDDLITNAAIYLISKDISLEKEKLFFDYIISSNQKLSTDDQIDSNFEIFIRKIIHENLIGYTSIDSETISSLHFEIKSKLDKISKISFSNFMPAKIKLSNNKEFNVEYTKTENTNIEATIEGYIQDFFGSNSIPMLLGKKTKISLLAPNKRSAQITSDINGFWKSSYPELSKAMKRDYPRHYWPENPETAKPILLKRNVQ